MTDVPFTVKPGAPGPWRSVQEALRQQHDEARKAVDEAIAKRKEKGIPLDDRADWRAAVGDLLDTVEDAKDRPAAVALLEKAHAIASPALRPLDAFEPSADLVGVEVRVRSVSKVVVMEMQAELAAIGESDDIAVMLRGNITAHGIWRRFLAKCIAGVRGIPVLDGLFAADNLTPECAEMATVLDVLDEGGFLLSFFTVARAYQVAGPLAKRLCGLSGQPTSTPFNAAVALLSDARSLDAKEVPPAPTSPTAIDSAQTCAPVSTPTVTLTSSTQPYGSVTYSGTPPA